MTPTLDTAAIRKRFEQAIIGIRADGTRAVLVETANIQLPMYPTLALAMGKPVWLDIVDGSTYTLEDFPTLIRPGDECEGSNFGEDWTRGIYDGIAGRRGGFSPVFKGNHWYNLIVWVTTVHRMA